MSSFGLKILALVLMVIDHMAEFLPGMRDRFKFCVNVKN